MSQGGLPHSSRLSDFVLGCFNKFGFLQMLLLEQLPIDCVMDSYDAPHTLYMSIFCYIEIIVIIPVSMIMVLACSAAG